MPTQAEAALAAWSPAYRGDASGTRGRNAEHFQRSAHAVPTMISGSPGSRETPYQRGRFAVFRQFRMRCPGGCLESHDAPGARQVRKQQSDHAEERRICLRRRFRFIAQFFDQKIQPRKRRSCCRACPARPIRKAWLAGAVSNAAGSRPTDAACSPGIVVPVARW